MDEKIAFRCGDGHKWLTSPANLVYKNVRERERETERLRETERGGCIFYVRACIFYVRASRKGSVPCCEF